MQFPFRLSPFTVRASTRPLPSHAFHWPGIGFGSDRLLSQHKVLVLQSLSAGRIVRSHIMAAPNVRSSTHKLDPLLPILLFTNLIYLRMIIMIVMACSEQPDASDCFPWWEDDRRSMWCVVLMSMAAVGCVMCEWEWKWNCEVRELKYESRGLRCSQLRGREVQE